MSPKASLRNSAKAVALPLLLLLGTHAAVAQAPTGQFTNSFALLPLWDFGGTYAFSNEWNSVSHEYVHHADGHITGVRTETFNMELPAISYDGSALDNGRVTSTWEGVGFVTSWKETIHGMADGRSFEGTKTAHSKWIVLPGALALQKEGTVRTCVEGRCASKTAVYQISLAAGMTGNWNLEFTLQAQGNKLAGGAVVALSNGRTLNYTVAGRYHPETQVSTLHFIGTGETRGTSMAATFSGPQMTLNTLTGSVLGQKLKYP